MIIKNSKPNNMTKFKDVAHLYMGCEVEWGFEGRKKKGQLVGNGERYGWQIFDPSNAIVPYQQCRIELIKPLLRPLDSMTEDEMDDVCRYTRDAQRTIGFRFSVGIEFIQPDLFNYFLKQGFDLFGLIPNGEAIDKTKTTQNG